MIFAEAMSNFAGVLLMALSCKPLMGEMSNSLDAGLKRHQPVEANLFCRAFVFLELTRTHTIGKSSAMIRF